ncbi:hypothetical protein [Nonomuraea insulae]|uniref:Uncharacterized protein n=1 Tax=Nonomuraea insulae TaxID=1616787 RepID=A0ABW1CBA5_9ACTN
MSRIRAAFWDRTSSRHSILTHPWRMAPPHADTHHYQPATARTEEAA